MIHKYIRYCDTNFHSDGLLDNDVRETPLFQKKKKTFDKDIFSHPIEVTGSMQFENNFPIMCLIKISTRTKKNWNISGRIKVDNFRESVSF